MNKLILSLIFCIALVFSSCEVEDDPTPENINRIENIGERVNTMKLFSLRPKNNQLIHFINEISLDETKEDNVKDALKEVKKVLPLELINRFDDVLFFNKLSDSHLKSIIKYELKRLQENACRNGLKLLLSKNLTDFIFSKVTDKEFGARSIKRIIQKQISDVISKEIVQNSKISNFDLFL